MKLFQKIIIITAFILAAIFFLYALSFSTNMAKGERVGSYFNEMQTFNHQIYQYSLYALAGFAVFLVVGSITKTRYNILNILSGLGGSLFLCVTAIYGLIHLPQLKQGYQALIGSESLDLTIIINLSKTPSTFIYDLGFVIYGLGVLVGLVCFGFIIYKIVERILYDKAYRKVKLYEST